MLDHSPGPPEVLPSSDTLSDVFMEPLLDQSTSNFEPVEFNFEFSDHNYRYDLLDFNFEIILEVSFVSLLKRFVCWL